MTSPWKPNIPLVVGVLFCLLHIKAFTCLEEEEAPVQSDGDMQMEEHLFPAEQPFTQLQSVEASGRKLLQLPGASLPYPPLKVYRSGQVCILFQSRRVSVRLDRQKTVDLTDRTFNGRVDTSLSVCTSHKAILVMRYGDVEDLRDLSISVYLSNSMVESSGQWWFSLDGVALRYRGNTTTTTTTTTEEEEAEAEEEEEEEEGGNNQEVAFFNASDVYAPSSTSYHCTHVTSTHTHTSLLLPGNQLAARWTVSFTNFQIQAFNITSGVFSHVSDCTTFLTPAILMGLITSSILLLVLAYALHMVIHLKHIEHEDSDHHKAHIFYPQDEDSYRNNMFYPPSPERHHEACCMEDYPENNTL